MKWFSFLGQLYIYTYTCYTFYDFILATYYKLDYAIKRHNVFVMTFQLFSLEATTIFQFLWILSVWINVEYFSGNFAVSNNIESIVE